MDSSFSMYDADGSTITIFWLKFDKIFTRVTKNND